MPFGHKHVMFTFPSVVKNIFHCKSLVSQFGFQRNSKMASLQALTFLPTLLHQLSSLPIVTSTVSIIPLFTFRHFLITQTFFLHQIQVLLVSFLSLPLDTFLSHKLLPTPTTLTTLLGKPEEGLSTQAVVPGLSRHTVSSLAAARHPKANLAIRAAWLSGCGCFRLATQRYASPTVSTVCVCVCVCACAEGEREWKDA